MQVDLSIRIVDLVEFTIGNRVRTELGKYLQEAGQQGLAGVKRVERLAG